MKIPKKLKIGAHHYEVVLTRDVFEGTTCGIQLSKDNQIGINSDLPETHQGATLIHEIFHAINSELDHALLDSLAEQVYQVFSDNQMLK